MALKKNVLADTDRRCVVTVRKGGDAEAWFFACRRSGNLP